MINKKLPIPKVSGIYKITCTVNNKFYIGSAISIRHRWINHRFDLRHNIHCNTYLQSSYNKYGEENFTIEIIEQCSVNDLIEREQFYLDTLKPFNSNGYNICPIAGHPGAGRKHSPETIQKIIARTTDFTLYRCIVLETKQVIRILQKQIHKEWGIKDFAAFIRKPGTWSKRGLVSFVEKEFNGRVYQDNEVEQFLIDVKTLRATNRSKSRKGCPGTFRGRKHSAASKAKMSLSKKINRERKLLML